MIGQQFFEHWRDVPARCWLWPNFTPAEIASKGDGSLLVVPDALDALQQARMSIDQPFRISSAYRDPAHNALVGGAPRSQHKEGHAFDVALAGYDKDVLVAALEAAGFTGLGLNYRTFVHADMGPRRRW